MIKTQETIWQLATDITAFWLVKKVLMYTNCHLRARLDYELTSVLALYQSGSHCTRRASKKGEGTRVDAH